MPLMFRFHPEKYYRPKDEEMRLIATVNTLAVWRSQGKAPVYHRANGRILYFGADLNAYLDASRVEPTERQPTSVRRVCGTENVPSPANGRHRRTAGSDGKKDHPNNL